MGHLESKLPLHLDWIRRGVLIDCLRNSGLFDDNLIFEILAFAHCRKFPFNTKLRLVSPQIWDGSLFFIFDLTFSSFNIHSPWKLRIFDDAARDWDLVTG